MLIINTREMLLEMDSAAIWFMLSSEERCRCIAEVDRLNSNKAFTLGIFSYNIQTIGNEENAKISSAEVRNAIATNNILMRICDDENGNHQYALERIDLSGSAVKWWGSVHSFVVEASQHNMDVIRRCIVKEIERREEGYESRISCLLDSHRILERSIPEAQAAFEHLVEGGVGHSSSDGVRMSGESADESGVAVSNTRMQIAVKTIPTRLYRKMAMRYGVEITVGDRQMPIYLGDKTQTMLYIMALLRHHIGEPLYLHELYKNSNGFKSPYSREVSVKWLRKVFVTIYGKTAKFQEWISPNGAGRRRAHDYHQAKSGISSKLKRYLAGDFAQAFDHFNLLTATDDKGDSYYTFKCKAEEVVLDPTANALCREFKKNLRLGCGVCLCKIALFLKFQNFIYI